MKGLETRVASQDIRIAQLKSDNENMYNQVASMKADMEKKVRDGRDVTKQLKASKSKKNMQRPYTGMTKKQRERLRKTHGDGTSGVACSEAGRKRTHSTDMDPKKKAKPSDVQSISEESEAFDSTAEA